MKRIGIIFGTFVAALVAVILIAPSFIDWTEYRASFESRIASSTGRDVSIDGDVSLALLPRPALRLGGLRVGSVEGATDQDFAHADAVAVNLAFGPLLSGRLQFTSIEVIKPIINAELLSDGRTTWSLQSKTTTEGSVPNVSNEDDVFDLGIDSLVFVDAVLNYRDATAGSTYQVAELDAELRADSMAGPYSVVGGAKAQGLTWQFEASVGVVRDDRPSPVVVTLVANDADVTIETSGQFSFVGGLPVGSGRVSMSGESAETPIKTFFQSSQEQTFASPLKSPYRLQARVELGDKSLAATDIQILLGGSQPTGTASVSWAGTPRFELDLKLGRLDLESWVVGAISSPTRFAELGGPFGISKSWAQSDNDPFVFSLPSAPTGTINLKVDLIEWRGQVIRDAMISASLAEAELTLVDVGAQMPGNASVQISGFVRAEDGQPLVDLVVNGGARNLRGFLNWLDVEPSKSLVPPSRLNALDARARLVGPLSRMTFEGIDIRLDTTRLTGSALYAGGQEPRINLDLALSNLDLDSYLPALREGVAGSGEDSGKERRASPFATDVLSDFTIALPGIAMEMKIAVDTLIAVDSVMTGVEFDAVADGEIISISTLSVDDIAGARVVLNGSFHDLTTAVRVENLVFDLVSDDLSRTGRALGIDLPVWPLAAEPIRLKTKISGALQQLAVSLEVSLNDLRIEVSGVATLTSASPGLTANLKITHPRYVDFLKGFGNDLSSETLFDGPVSVAGAFMGDAKTLKLENLSMRVGENELAADLSLDSAAEVPILRGSIHIANLDLDSTVPQDATAELTKASRGRSTSGSGGVSGRWSTEPIIVSNMSGFATDLNVTADKIVGRGVVLERLTAPVSMTNGVVTFANWQGEFYGGPASGDLTIWLSPTLRVEARLDVKDALIERLNGAGSSVSSASGKASLQGGFAATGASQRDLITTLSGNGAFLATGLDARGGAQGPFLSAVLSPVRALSQLGGVLGGGVSKGFASMSASFNGESGVFMLSDAIVKSNVYSGEFAGAVDLPRWWVEVDGRVRLEANVITELLGNRLQLPSLIPVSVKGQLDAPNVKMDTNTGGASSAKPLQPVPAEAPPTAIQPPNPLDLFQGILNEVVKPQ